MLKDQHISSKKFNLYSNFVYTCITKLSERAVFTLRPNRFTNFLTVPNEQPINLEPVFFRYEGFEGIFCMFGGASIHQTDKICDSMYVRVNGYCRFPEPIGQNTVCGLSAHAG